MIHTTTTAAALLGVTPQRVRQLLAEGKLQGTCELTPRGPVWVLRTRDIHEYMRRRKQAIIAEYDNERLDAALYWEGRSFPYVLPAHYCPNCGDTRHTDCECKCHKERDGL